MKELETFCHISEITSLTEVDKAKGLIWFAMRLQNRPAAYLPFVIDLFVQANLARPNLARLRRNLKADRQVLKRADLGEDQFGLQRESLQRFDAEFGTVFAASQPEALRPFAQKLIERARTLKDPALAKFVSEAIGCMNRGYYRAAVVLAWQGAMGLLEAVIFNQALADFNREAISRSFIKKAITRIEEFQKLQETDKLTAAEAAHVISKSVKIALEECLRRRNNCGHPNDFEIGEAQVAAHLESLLNHVFLRH